MAWHTTREAGTTQKCVKYPDRVGFTTILVGGYSTVLSHKARNDWAIYIANLAEYAEYRVKEQQLLAAQYQQQGHPKDISWTIIQRELAFHNATTVMFLVAEAWTEGTYDQGGLFVSTEKDSY